MDGGRINYCWVVDDGVMDDGVGSGNVEGTECGGSSGGVGVAAGCGRIVGGGRSGGGHGVSGSKDVFGAKNNYPAFFNAVEVLWYLVSSRLWRLGWRRCIFFSREVDSRMGWVF